MMRNWCRFDSLATIPCQRTHRKRWRTMDTRVSSSVGMINRKLRRYLLRLDGTGELGYDGPLYDGFLHMTDDMLGPSLLHIKYSSYQKWINIKYVYPLLVICIRRILHHNDGPFFLVPLSLSYPSSPVIVNRWPQVSKNFKKTLRTSKNRPQLVLQCQ